MIANIKAWRIFWFGLFCLVVQGAAADAPGHDQPQNFQFRFELNRPLVFQFTVTTKNITDRTMQLETGNKSSLTRTTQEIRFKAKFTPVRQSGDGTWKLHFEPLDFEQDLDVVGAGGSISTTLRGLAVKTTQNGIVVVDTDKGIGIAQAKNFKQTVFPKLLSGYFDLNPTGGVVKVDGDLPFIDHWTDALQYQVGLFDLCFSGRAVVPGDAWNSTLTLKNLEGLQLTSEGILETNRFAREFDSLMETNVSANFSQTMAVNLKNISGSIEQMGQNTMLNISSFNHNKSGKFQFDAVRGCILNASFDEDLKTTVDMLVQGHDTSMSIDMETHSAMQLLDGAK